MSLSQGREFLSIPGPSVMPDRVLRAMHRGAPNIYEGALVEMSEQLHVDLARIARTESRAFIYVANGHGAWEAALCNTLSRGDRVLVLESGRFAVGWGEMAAAMGVQIEILHSPERRGIAPEAVEARLRADAGAERPFDAVVMVQIDTASSVWNDVAAVRAAIDAVGHSALFMVDCIASLGSVPFEMDGWGVDVTVGGSQKGLMTPPGLGFVWASPRALEIGAKAGLRTAYWDWEARDPEHGVHYKRYCGTPPVHHLYGLREALDMIFEEGLEAVWTRHARIARAVRAAAEHWGQGGAVALNITDPAGRADSVTTLLARGFDANAMRLMAQEEFGLVLGVGLGDLATKSFRIGHMGWLNAPMILGTLATTELALRSIGATIRSGGVEAAIEALQQA